MAKARKPKEDQDSGPYLDAALVCEQVIREKDGAFSAIRLVNRLTIHDVAPASGTTLVSPLMLLVSFKAGEFNGSQELSLYVEDPSRSRHDLYQRTTLTFQGGDTGQTVA